jgi:hypothetical protein
MRDKMKRTFEVHRTVNDEQIYPAFYGATGNSVSSIVLDGDIKRVTVNTTDRDALAEFVDDFNPGEFTRITYMRDCVDWNNGKIVPNSQHERWVFAPDPDHPDFAPDTTDGFNVRLGNDNND